MYRGLIIVWLFILVNILPAWASDESSRNFQQAKTQSIYYFDKNWKNVAKPTSDGFYRKVLKIKENGCIIQDFYQNSNKKQSDPILLTDKTDLLAGGPASIEGKLVLWHENGQKSMEVFYKNNQKQGLLQSWHKNGYKKLEQTYHNDQENGIATYWNEEGMKQLEFNFENGNLNLVSSWKEGRKISETHYFNNKKEGVSTYWYHNGSIKEIAHYHENKLNGLYTSFYPDGSKESEIFYNNDFASQINFWYTNNKKAADLTRADSKQLTCSIWDEQETLVYQGDNRERCILTVRNIFNEEKITNY